ncbi:hypothetical protein SEA_ATUIN_1 [Arthrobacter phage Atuin]|nr:hypothetical protein SEA_ATUIN_100 [Arthrobacter phage Atuin]
MFQNPFAPDNDLPEPPENDLIQPSRSPSAGKTSPAEQGLEVPAGWKPTAAEPVPVVRCHGIASTTGERCKRWSLRGTTVCRKHGAQLQNVRDHADAVVESARLQILGMADDAVDVLADLIKTGVRDDIRLKAAESILNRSGIKDAIEMKVEVKTNNSAAEDIQKKLAVMAERMTPKEDPEDLGEILDEPENLPEEPIHEAPEKTETD